MGLHIGILRTDNVLEQFQAAFGDYPQMFEQLLARATDETLQFTHYDVRVAVPDAVACDAYIITGSRHSVYEDLPWIGDVAAFVDRARDAGARIVGICFGHQLLAHFFGGEVGPADAGWAVGVHVSQLTRLPDWVDDDSAPVRLLSSHKDQVKRLPQGAEPYLTSEFCPIGGFTLPGVLTMQGHPEFNADYARELMGMRRELIGEQTYQRGIASLAQPTDELRAARWILNFIQPGLSADEACR